MKAGQRKEQTPSCYLVLQPAKCLLTFLLLCSLRIMSSRSFDVEKRKQNKTCYFYQNYPSLPDCSLDYLSSFFSVGNKKKRESSAVSESTVISPLRWLRSTLIPILFVTWGLRRRAVCWSGALVGFAIAVVLSLSNDCFLACLATFFVTGSKATKFGSERKHSKCEFSCEPYTIP